MKFVLWGTYCPDALERRTPFRDEHLAGLRQQKERGVLLTLGPTEGSTHVFGIYEAEDQAAVEALVKGDIYWRQGIWTEVAVYHWIQAF
ncbi:MAG: YciI family protein [Cyanobium sp.]